jgi:hypothetical protein
MTWGSGADIWLYKKSDGERVLYGSAPDVGAHELLAETESDCTDGVDNDLDGDIDCADSECDGATGPSGETCEYGTELTCDDGYDNDADGDIDCAAETDCTSPAVVSCSPKQTGVTGSMNMGQ